MERAPEDASFQAQTFCLRVPLFESDNLISRVCITVEEIWSAFEFPSEVSQIITNYYGRDLELILSREITFDWRNICGIKMGKALVVVDVQNDFVDGSLVWEVLVLSVLLTVWLGCARWTCCCSWDQ